MLLLLLSLPLRPVCFKVASTLLQTCFKLASPPKNMRHRCLCLMFFGACFKCFRFKKAFFLQKICVLLFGLCAYSGTRVSASLCISMGICAYVSRVCMRVHWPFVPGAHDTLPLLQASTKGLGNFDCNRRRSARVCVHSSQRLPSVQMHCCDMWPWCELIFFQGLERARRLFGC